MKTASWFVTSLGMAVAVLMLGQGTPVLAQEGSQGAVASRLERLENRLNQLANQQERLMNRSSSMADAHGLQATPPAGPDREGPQAAAPALRGQWPGPVAKAAAWKCHGLVRLVLLVSFLCHILLAIWVYTDIRKRGEGHGIFIVLTLLAGFFGAGLYALVRLGEKKA